MITRLGLWSSRRTIFIRHVRSIATNRPTSSAIWQQYDNNRLPLEWDTNIRQFPLPGNIAPIIMNNTEINTELLGPYEFKLTKCPQLIRRDLLLLFPDLKDIQMNLIDYEAIDHKKKLDISVITVSQKSEYDQMQWSLEMEDERLLLTDKFVHLANEVVTSLRTMGYWADFIDPTSGQPFNGHVGAIQLFETDELYRHFGFEIEDLGCCRVLSHHRWGTKAFVGSIFTNAPVHLTLMKEFVK
ncbi:hypothetical protein SNEBB_001604 [Seison nebaliae]|nr:hypothetical protein SNEBB_001604 [Seison nebaliae]